MMGVATGSLVPRWQEKQVTSRRPSKLSLLIAIIMVIILRAVTLGFLSSFSIAPCTWQYSHSTPSEALINCIEGTTWSAGMPLSTWIFLNCSSASLEGVAAGAGDCCEVDCALAAEKPR